MSVIAELLQLARINGLTGCKSTRPRRIHWFIDLDTNGRVVGFSPTVSAVNTAKGKVKERRGKEFDAFANYHMQWKNGKVQGVCTNDSNWMPDHYCPVQLWLTCIVPA